MVGVNQAELKVNAAVSLFVYATLVHYSLPSYILCLLQKWHFSVLGNHPDFVPCIQIINYGFVADRSSPTYLFASLLGTSSSFA